MSEHVFQVRRQNSAPAAVQSASAKAATVPADLSADGAGLDALRAALRDAPKVKQALQLRSSLSQAPRAAQLAHVTRMAQRVQPIGAAPVRARRGLSTSSNAIVQRAIGFEFEVPSLSTYQPRHFYQSVGTAENDPLSRRPLQKGDVILEGNGFEMQADERTGGSDVEFVTDAFDEFAGVGLTNAVNSIAQIATHIDGIAAPWKRASGLAGFGTVRKPRVFMSQFGPLVAKPQTTAGVGLDQLFRLMTEIGVAQAGEAPGDTANRLPGRQQLMSLPAAPPPFGGAIVPGPAITRVGNATSSVVAAIAAYQAAVPYLMHTWVPSEEIKGILALLTTYLDAARHPLPNYAKAIAPIMARTDFAQLFRMLPTAEREYFAAHNGGEWLALIGHIPMLAGLNMANPVFEGGINRGDPIGPGVYPNPDLGELAALTRSLWLRGMTQGTDLLTRRNFPTALHRDEVESMGSLGSKTEPVGLGGRLGAIFELRGMAGVPIAGWVPLAQAVLTWVRRKNQADPRAFAQP